MIVCKFPFPETQEVVRPIPTPTPCECSDETARIDHKLAALRALGAVGFHILHYSYQESKFRVELIGTPAGLCIELSSQEYFKFTQAMESQQEAVESQQEVQPKAPEELTTTEEKLTEVSPAESTKGKSKGRYLRKMLPMLGIKTRTEKENSHMQMRQRISMLMICILRLFEKKKKATKATKATTTTTETAKEELKEEPSAALSL
ncbi:hypothetical protein MPTK1_4g10790 [Marchantia polymorpha subsp. ruderalis]|uniref:Uncharacterized protein n=2 Tax=Marchantia polymorpha TaxID=3197 RepID=A0A176W9A6_MARPO|nr:hypothetical protein AXG93_3036s1220 [Marchantia polymorpha subsp. ruderalis]PTQ46379.1 hypothetical protein MARPO_0011s0065 [Marchantia polymorpha]BBN08343.1 hypothetical protein Mp_4g10790 [Marchantia polymorpha subsp. ruderalis]|eukprot:PTQ46379.1 hypothetical protein MARPO_0011s0065 [Marchantia polymorpha]